jgi:hypothetical protein
MKQSTSNEESCLLDETPNDQWSLSELSRLIKSEQDTIQSFARKMAVHVHRLGHALTLANGKVSRGKWAKFLKRHRISVSSDNRARAIYSFFSSEADLEGLTITQAYRKADIPLGNNPTKVSADNAKASTNGNDDPVDDIDSESHEFTASVESKPDDPSEDDVDEPEVSRSGRSRSNQNHKGQEPELPPKEAPDTFAMRLAQWVALGQWLSEEASTIRLKKEELDLYLTLLNEIKSQQETIVEAINHA